MTGAESAYAWIHLPDRYVRTWLALEVLVERCLLPMGKEGVRALDVGTGPGPSAFATHDFYAAMMRYADITGRERWRQPRETEMCRDGMPDEPVPPPPRRTSVCERCPQRSPRHV